MMELSSRLGKIFRALGSLAVAAGAAAVTTSAFAQPAGHHPSPGWHGDISRFHEHDWGVWRGGHWTHGNHGGHMGWWWVAGGVWYFYPAPVYPYPNPWEPPPAYLVTPQAGEVPPPPPTQFWYYCEASRAYYPYAATCPGGWKQVPATPN